MQTIKESSISRLLRQGSRHDVGCISAFRTGVDKKGRNRFYRTNKNISKELYHDLKSKGYSITSVGGGWQQRNEEGGYDDPSTERSFYVVDVQDSGDLFETLKSLGYKYEQDCIYFKPAGGRGIYVGTNDKNRDKETNPSKRSVYGKTHDFGKGFKAYTKVGDRPFTDDIDTDVLYSDEDEEGDNTIESLKKAKAIIDVLLKKLGVEEDAETVDVAAFQQAHQQQNAQSQEQQTQAQTPKLATKDDVDKMDDSQILSQALSANQDNYDVGAKQELVDRTSKLLQKNQTGTLSKNDRDNIINSIINMKNEEI